jgi:uncharacterized protein (DUF58 family)
VLRIIRELIEFKPKSKKTNISQAITFLSSIQKKRAIVFLISDFITLDPFEQPLKIAAKKHDITGVRVYDYREKELPNLGFIAIEDAESNQVTFLNTALKKVRDQYTKNYENQVAYFENAFSKSGSGVVNTRVDESYVTKLLGYFKSR